MQLSESQDEVDRLLKERQTMAENIAALEAKTCHLSAAVEESAAKQPNAGESDEKLAEMQTHVNQLSADLAESRTQNADLLKRLAESEATAQTVTAEKQQLVTLVQVSAWQIRSVNAHRDVHHYWFSKSTMRQCDTTRNCRRTQRRRQSCVRRWK